MRRGLPGAFGVAAVLVLAGVAAPAGAAPSAPAVGFVSVAGRGAGDLVRATGTGFAAGVSAAVSLVGTSSTAPLVTTTADSTGTVTLPTDTRIPPTASPGSFRLTVTQAGGLSATSPAFGIVAPQLSVPENVVPGEPALFGHYFSEIRLFGLANSPDVVRSVTIDGVPVVSHWADDDAAFTDPNIVFAPPADLTVGEHRVVFTQTGPTPFTDSGTVAVVPPSVANLPAHVAPLAGVPLTIWPTVWNDDFDVTIVGAAGDRHTGMHWVVQHGPDDIDITTESDRVTPGRLSPGTATVTAVSVHNGATATATFVVDPTGVTSPAGLVAGQSLVDDRGTVHLDLQADGNLVLYQQWGPALWSTNPKNHVPGSQLSVQSDGNVVLRAPDGRAMWNPGTAGIGAGARFGLDPGGNVAVFTASGRQAWSSFTTDTGYDTPVPFVVGSVLFRGASLTNDGGPASTLTMQTDGNLVLHTFRGGVWSTRTFGHPNSYAVLQTDGNLVVHAVDGAVLWANYAHATGARILVQSDGNVVEYASNGKAVWSTRTSAR